VTIPYTVGIAIIKIYNKTSRIDIDIADLYLIYVMLTLSLKKGNNNLIKYDTVCWRYTINNL